MEDRRYLGRCHSIVLLGTPPWFWPDLAVADRNTLDLSYIRTSDALSVLARVLGFLVINSSFARRLTDFWLKDSLIR
jgi:hypothetical protein